MDFPQPHSDKQLNHFKLKKKKSARSRHLAQKTLAETPEVCQSSKQLKTVLHGKCHATSIIGISTCSAYNRDGYPHTQGFAFCFHLLLKFLLPPEIQLVCENVR